MSDKDIIIQIQAIAATLRKLAHDEGAADVMLYFSDQLVEIGECLFQKHVDRIFANTALADLATPMPENCGGLQ